MKKFAITLCAALGLFCSTAAAVAAEAVDFASLPKLAPGLKIVTSGWSGRGVFKTVADIENVPYFSKGRGNAGAFPFTNHFAEFAFAKSEKVSRIVLNIGRTDVKCPIADADFAKIAVYTSADGKKFTAVKSEIEPVVPYINRAPGSGGSKPTGLRLTVKGNFEGKYFRIYLPWKNKSYAFRLILSIDCKAYAN